MLRKLQILSGPILIAAALLAGCATLSVPDGNASHDPAPDFSLPDLNPASPRFNQNVSPRDYRGQISAWYFGHST